jgi:nucleotide-binding universal stress UspA family protein
MRALVYVNRIAEALKADVIGLNVVQVPVWNCYEIDEQYCKELIDSIEAMKHKRIQLVESKLEKIAIKERREGISFRYSIRDGRANEEIVKVAREEGAGLIVMGNKGDDSEGIGSTVFKVIKAAQIPTMVVKRVRKRGEINKILVPVDLREGWSKVFEVALEFSDRMGADIYMLHVIEIYSYEGIDEVQDKLLSYATKMVEDRANLLKEKAGKIRVYEFARKAINASIGIMDFIKRERIDMVIMGTHARTGIGRFILGSVSERVMNESSIPVIAVPSGE